MVAKKKAIKNVADYKKNKKSAVATSRSAVKKTVRSGKAATGQKPPAKKRILADPLIAAPLWAGRKPCNTQEICKYLAELSIWLEQFLVDYARLRKAVCNVERKAYSDGDDDPFRRFCRVGHGEEPNPPVRPPIWD